MKHLILSLLLISSTAAFAQEGTENSFAECVVVDEDMNRPAYLDWPNIRGIRGLEICLFQIVPTLGNNQSISQFLLASGFSYVSSRSYDLRVVRGIGIDVAGYLFSANMPIEELPDFFGGWLGFETWGAYSLSVGLYVDEQGRPLRISATYTRK